MKTEITTALIGLAGVVCGALLKIFAEEIKPLFLGRSKTNRDLLGSWNCEWTIDAPNPEPTISDSVQVTKVSGDKIAASAETPRVGKYSLSGRISASGLVTLSSSGADNRRFLGGVVIVKLNSARDTMRGHWNECDKEGVFWQGGTTWKKNR